MLMCGMFLDLVGLGFGLFGFGCFGFCSLFFGFWFGWVWFRQRACCNNPVLFCNLSFVETKTLLILPTMLIFVTHFVPYRTRGCTNQPLSELDSAVLRPGRLEMHIHIQQPTFDDRKAIAAVE